MAKKKSDIFSKVAGKTGGKVLSDVSPVKYFIDTGNLAVNYVCSGKFIGGGVPSGKIIEVLGPSAGGKSYWGTNIVRGTQALDGIAVYLDCENALNPDFACKTSHINPDEMIRYGPADGIEHLEGLFLKIYNVIRAVRAEEPEKPLVFIYDSISVSPCKRELSEVNLPENYNKTEFKSIVGGKEQPGERAKICNKEFRKLEAILEKTNVTMVVINQLRQKIGVLYGSKEIGAAASTVLEYYSSCRLRTSAHLKIDNKKLGVIAGVNMKMKNLKNRTHRPFLVAENIQLFFDKGVNPISGLLTAFIQAERIQKTGKSTYTVNEPWAAGQTINFKASLVRNDVDPEILYKCPLLIDAANEEEVKNYLAIFGDVIDAAASEDYKQTEVSNEFFFGEEGEEQENED